ncbi:MFS transporter [Kitasatospora mediocidica]|uniref:MFS transporter n=1 Tax=Kitasatospora mediocidica TaxID=58352 RepID=UPI00068CF258|nr:MFS transporter [Kitasatospora mediocidica]
MSTLTTATTTAPGPSAPDPAALPPLGRIFWMFWSGRSLSTLGGYLQFLALPLWVQQTTGSALAGVLAFVVFHLPKMLLSPFAGLIADRYDRRRVAIITDLAAALVTVGMAVAAGAHDVPLLLVLLGLLQVLAVVRVPALSCILPDAIPAGRLTTANSLLDATSGAAMTLGPLLGTALLASVGIGWVLLLNGATFVVAALCMLPLAPSPAGALTTQTGIAALASGVRALVGDPVLRYAVAAESTIYLFVGAVTEQLAICLGQTGSDGAVGAFGVGTGIGWIAVTLALARSRSFTSMPRLLLWGTLAAAPVSICAVLLVQVGAWLPAAAAAGLIVSVHQFLYSIGPVQLCQQRAENSFRGRVMAMRRMATSTSQLVSLAGGALFAEVFGMASVVLVSGILATALAVPLARMAQRAESASATPGVAQ